jgi:hypothetical protein
MADSIRAWLSARIRTLPREAAGIGAAVTLEARRRQRIKGACQKVRFMSAGITTSL